MIDPNSHLPDSCFALTDNKGYSLLPRSRPSLRMWYSIPLLSRTWRFRDQGSGSIFHRPLQDSFGPCRQYLDEALYFLAGQFVSSSIDAGMDNLTIVDRSTGCPSSSSKCNVVWMVAVTICPPMSAVHTVLSRRSSQKC